MRVSTIAGALALAATIGACSEDEASPAHEASSGGVAGGSASGGRSGDTGGGNGSGGSERGGAAGVAGPAGAGGADGADPEPLGGAAGSAVGGAGEEAGGEEAGGGKPAPAGGGSGGDEPVSPFDGWWRGVSPADRILIDNEVVTELQVTIYYEWEGTECDTVLSMSEPAELSDRPAVAPAGFHPRIARVEAASPSSRAPRR